MAAVAEQRKSGDGVVRETAECDPVTGVRSLMIAAVAVGVRLDHAEW
jgi:hypothetical protein